MARKAIKTTINGVRYDFNTMPATKALQVFGFFVEVLGEGGSKLAPIANQLSDMNSEVDPNVLAEAIRGFTSRASDPRVIESIGMMLEGVIADGRSIDLDEHFSCSTMSMLELATFAFKENFKDFFESALVAKFTKGAAGAMKQQLTGGSGESS